MLSIGIIASEVKIKLESLQLLPGAPLKFPKRLTNPHLVAINTQSYLNGDRDWNNKKPLYISYYGNKKFLSRILLMIDYLVKFLEFRGYKFDKGQNDEVFCNVKGMEIKFSFRQTYKRVANTTLSYKSYDLEETDIIVLQICRNSWDRKEWKDTVNILLEDRILYIVAYIEVYVEKEILERAERERKQKMRDEENERLEALKKLELLEKQKVDDLRESAYQFEKAEKIYNYLNKRKEFLIKKELYTDVEKEYYEWGILKTKQIDPLENL